MSSSSATRVAASHSLWLNIDVRMFQLLGAGHGPTWLLRVASFWATWSWVVLLGLTLWVCADKPHGLALAAGLLLQAGLAQWVGKRLARRWNAARPFALGLCPNHLKHGGRAGFPSSHALVMGIVVGCLLTLSPSAGIQAAAIGLLLSTSWARVHTGAHFPSDVLVACAVGLMLAPVLWGM
jgi:undecaprenyl-diphosphatase